MSFTGKIKHFVLGTKDVIEMADYPLPLYLRQSMGLPPPKPPTVNTCSECETRYFARVEGSFIAEDGMCHACSTGAPRGVPARMAQVTQFEQARKRKRR